MHWCILECPAYKSNLVCHCRYKVLREALPSDLAGTAFLSAICKLSSPLLCSQFLSEHHTARADDAVSIAASGLSIESDNAEVGISELQLCGKKMKFFMLSQHFPDQQSCLQL